MCRSRKVYGHCDCGIALTCRDALMCNACYENWMDVEDSELLTGGLA